MSLLAVSQKVILTHERLHQLTVNEHAYALNTFIIRNEIEQAEVYNDYNEQVDLDISRPFQIFVIHWRTTHSLGVFRHIGQYNAQFKSFSCMRNDLADTIWPKE